MKGACNDASVAAGDITAGITLANTCGGRLTKKVGGKQPDFGIIAAGPGWVLVHARKCRKGEEGHIFRVAIVTAKGVIPVKGSYTDYVSLQSTIQLSDLTSGTILAINHASIVPISRTKSPSLTPMAKTKKTAKASLTDKHHPIFSITSPDPYTWDGWIYIGIL
jgi:hypothetical protein